MPKILREISKAGREISKVLSAAGNSAEDGGTETVEIYESDVRSLKRLRLFLKDADARVEKLAGMKLPRAESKRCEAICDRIDELESDWSKEVEALYDACSSIDGDSNLGDLLVLDSSEIRDSIKRLDDFFALTGIPSED